MEILLRVFKIISGIISTKSTFRKSGAKQPLGKVVPNSKKNMFRTINKNELLLLIKNALKFDSLLLINLADILLHFFKSGFSKSGNFAPLFLKVDIYI